MSRGAMKSLTNDEQMQLVVEEALAEGWEAEKTSGGHIKFTHPLASKPVFGSSTPSDYRSTKNTQAKLSRELRRSMDELSGDDLIETVARDRKYARIVDETLRESGTDGVFGCPACMGRGANKAFFSAEALAVHMEKVHPAPPIELDEPEEETPQEAEMPKQSILENDFSLEEFENFMRENPNQEFSIDDIISLANLYDTMKVRKAIANRVITARKRLERAGDGELKNVGRGRYIYFPAQEEEELEEPAPVNNVVNNVSTAPAPEPQPEPEPKTTTIPSGRLFEWVTSTADGRAIVKDDQGKVYFATFEEL